MLRTNTTCFVLCLFATLSVFSQNKRPKIYFDKSGRSCSENLANYYREETDSASFFKSYFVTNNKLAFQGKITSPSSDDENKNVYQGKCTWYYKNGTVRSIRTYNEQGEETGNSRYFHESGKIWKEIEYVKNKPSQNFYVEYDEYGTKNRIFEEEFLNNNNEWDLFLSDKSLAVIENGSLKISSTSREGTSRYINHTIESTSYAIEASIGVVDIKDNDKVGIIFGFKDWQNYHYFAISKNKIYIGSVYEGVKSISVDAMFCSAINHLQTNVVKIICNGENYFYSVNGEVQYKDRAQRLYANNFGLVLSGNANLKVERFVIKEIDISTSGSSYAEPSDIDVKATGSGIIFSSAGHILTNYHVVENSSEFVIEINSSNGKKSYRVDVVMKDKDNDLAIIKIKGESFSGFPEIKYAFKENGQIDVGGTVFTIGYPYALSGMGKEAKFTDGKISAKTGYNGVINTFQTTIPVQPGNSGGPVFNDKGQMIGVINATFREADNVSYAIKLNYINNLIELLPEKVELPSNNSVNSLSLEEKIKTLTNYVVLIKVK
jgi:S1-C subfamily serine protease